MSCGIDRTGSSESVFFNHVPRRLVGKIVMSHLRPSGLPREIAAIVFHKCTLVV
jgi:hypothetical protein